MSILIFLNGCSSSGKTSIAQSIQHLSDEPWLRIGIDMFIDMLPDRFIATGEKAKEGYFSFIPGQNHQGPLIHIENGPLGDKFFKLAPPIIKLFADQNHNLIIDEVLFGNEMLKLYIDQLKMHKVYFIGVFCSLENMQEREILRRDRAVGLANDQVNRVHTEIREYDLTVNTNQVSSFNIAKNILTFIKNTPEPQGFKKIEAFFKGSN